MTMRRTLLTLSAVAGTALALAAAPAAGERVNVTLTGFEEVPVNTSSASGSLRLFINDREGMIDYELTFEGLQGNVTQAHIHVAQAGVNGGIVLWLCGTAHQSRTCRYTGVPVARRNGHRNADVQQRHAGTRPIDRSRRAR